MLTLQLLEEVERRLEILARDTGHPASFHAERAIIDYLDDLEDYRAAEREGEASRAGRSASVPLNAMMKSNRVAG